MGFAQLVGPGFFPLDEELELLPGGLSPSLEEALVRLGAWMPFEQAEGLLVDLLRLTGLSEATARRHTEAAGAAYVALQEQAVAEMEQGLPPPPPGPAKLVLEVDGAMVPLVGGEWAEVKTLLIGEVGQPVQVQGEWQVPLEGVSSFSRLSDCESFARLALVETQRRGVTTAQQVGVVADGAEWIQGFVDFHCPDAVRILDFPHAAEYVGAIGQGVFGQGTPTTKGWLSQQLHHLKHQGGSVVLAQLGALIQSQGEGADLSAPLAYLQKREAQMHYPTFQAQGWPIGSGEVESANKLVVEARLKGAGMHWARQHVNPMLALRNIVCSERWAEAWPQMAAYLRQQATQRRQGWQQRRRLQLTEGATMSVGETEAVGEPLGLERQPGDRTAPPESNKPYRPAPDHPWRRSPIGRARYQPAPSISLPKL